MGGPSWTFLQSLPPFPYAERSFSGSRPKGRGLDGRNPAQGSQTGPQTVGWQQLRTAPLGLVGLMQALPGSKLSERDWELGTRGEGRDRHGYAWSSSEGASWQKPKDFERFPVNPSLSGKSAYQFWPQARTRVPRPATSTSRRFSIHVVPPQVNLAPWREGVAPVSRDAALVLGLFPETQLCSYGCSADFRRVL